MVTKGELFWKACVLLAWVIGLLLLWTYQYSFSEDDTDEMSRVVAVFYIFTGISALRCKKSCICRLTKEECEGGLYFQQENPQKCRCDYLCAILTGTFFGFFLPILCTGLAIACAVITEDGGGKAVAGAGAAVCVLSCFPHAYIWAKPRWSYEDEDDD